MDSLGFFENLDEIFSNVVCLYKKYSGPSFDITLLKLEWKKVTAARIFL